MTLEEALKLSALTAKKSEAERLRAEMNGIAAFAAVMDRFFGLYVHANSFTQLDILSATNGDILVSCKPRSGESILA